MVKKSRSNDKTYQEWINSIYNFVEIYGRAPFWKELESSDREFIKRCGNGRYNDGLRVIGITPLTKAEIAKIKEKRTEMKWRIKILEMTKEFGRAPTIKEIKERYTNISSRFPTYNKVLFQMGITSNRDVQKYNYTENELIEMYSDLCKRLGKTATNLDIEKEKKIPSAAYFVQKFDSLEKLRELSKVEQINPAYYRYSKVELDDLFWSIYVEYGLVLKQKDLLMFLREKDFKTTMITIRRYYKKNDLKDIWNEILIKKKFYIKI